MQNIIINKTFIDYSFTLRSSVLDLSSYRKKWYRPIAVFLPCYQIVLCLSVIFQFHFFLSDQANIKKRRDNIPISLFKVGS